ncbi:MAG: hypothetical protein HY481_00530 [Candidatus Vogelbacteria bacterium]|nr:hypothetical protein [Candidatus Vogelbacteria bacterium]
MNWKNRFLLALAIFALWFAAAPAEAARLLLSPSTGVFTVGSTFEVAIFLDTEGQPVNAVEAVLNFPPDKLQLISPSAGHSVISVWTAQPIFNNQSGVVRLTGGIPGGINVNRGLITSLTFRVKQVADRTLIKFTNDSRLLANDGRGTEILSDTQNGVYNLILPPPAGPAVASETHPDQTLWYRGKNVILRWTALDQVEQYSFILNQDPLDIPDDIAEGTAAGVTYKDLADGAHYFHIKARRGDLWGGVTHFAINIDAKPPAEFPIEIAPAKRTTSNRPIIYFATTDAESGLSHYEIKIVALTPDGPDVAQAETAKQPFFIEATSPYSSLLGFGAYDIIIRAYDQAGNYREGAERLTIVTPFLGLITGPTAKIVSLALLILSLGLGFYVWRLRHWHLGLTRRKNQAELPADLKSKLTELKQYRQKYGHLIIILAAGLTGLYFSNQPALAQSAETVPLSPPYVSSISRHLSNQEIFYIGGKTDNSGVTVSIYLQNLQTGETMSSRVVSDSKGDWFYRHSNFLSPGNYLLWTQSRLGELASPPSPQLSLSVNQTAIQFGASRLSYEALYLILSSFFLFIIIGLVVSIFYHRHHGRKKRAAIEKEITEAEEAVRRGFALLRHDLEKELKLVRRTKTGQAVKQEAELLADLESIQKNIGREVWDIERVLDRTNVV